MPAETWFIVGVNQDSPDDLTKGSVPESWNKTPAPAARRPDTEKKVPAPLKPHELTLALIFMASFIVVINSFSGGPSWIESACFGFIGYQVIWNLIFSAVKAAKKDSDKKE